MAGDMAEFYAFSCFPEELEDYYYSHPNDSPSEIWVTKYHESLKVSEMSTEHIKNCLSLEGLDGKWVEIFNKELNKREVNF